MDDQALPERFAFEAIFSALQKTLSDLLQTPVEDLSVDFPYERPDDTDPFQLIFGDQIKFNTGRAIFTLPDSMMSRPLPTSNPTLKTLYNAECARLLADLSDTASYTERTLQALEKLQGHYPRLEQMAAMLNISARTYRRRLARRINLLSVAARSKSSQVCQTAIISRRDGARYGAVSGLQRRI